MGKKKRIDFKYNLGIYLGLLKNYYPLFFSLVFIALIVETIHVLDSFLFKVIIDKGTEFTAKTISSENFVNILLIIAITFISVSVLKNIARWINLHNLNKLEGSIIKDLKEKFFNHILGLSYRFHTTHKTGSLISRLVRGGRAMESMTDLLVFRVFPLFFQFIVAGAALLYFDLTVFIVLASIIVIFVVYNLLIQNLQQKLNVAYNDQEDFEKANIGDFFANIESIKYFGKDGYIKKKFSLLAEKTRRAAVKYWNFFRWSEPGQSLIISFGTFFMVYFPLVKFLNGEMTIGTVAFIYTVYGGLIAPLYNFVYGIRDFYKVMADFEALFEYNKIQNDIVDKKDAKELKVKEGDVEFRNITFGFYKKKLLSDFNLKVPKNKRTALVGHSGSGKTTLVKLLYRFYDVEDGRILIDGKDIRDFKQESLRSELSTVPQECVLFDDTIYNNISFSNPKASRKEVMKAMKFAQLDKVVKSFPYKEETIVGERGIRLSGGEKQRVSIARAILADKRILVLDEATSSLDSITEYSIQKDLWKLMEGRTCVIIAHRLSTIMKADNIIVLKKGKIVQQGTHKQLIKQKGEYKHLWSIQRGGYIK